MTTRTRRRAKVYARKRSPERVYCDDSFIHRYGYFSPSVNETEVVEPSYTKEEMDIAASTGMSIESVRRGLEALARGKP